MRKFILTATTALLSLNVYSQGTVLFANFASGGLNAPVFLSDNVTKASGPAWMAILLAGPTPSNLAQIATTPFLSGSGAGYFFGGAQTLTTVMPGATAYCQVGFWDSTLNGTTSGATFQQAMTSGVPNVWGQSIAFPVQTGGVGTPASSPGLLLGLMVPEPSLSTLLGLGATMMIISRRRR